MGAEWNGSALRDENDASSLVPRPSHLQFLIAYCMYAIKNWRRERPGNEATEGGFVGPARVNGCIVWGIN